MRFIGRRDGVSEALLEQMDWAERETAEATRDHALRRLQLRRSGRDRSTPPQRYQRRRRGRLPRSCSTRRRCTIPTWSSAPAASSGCRTSCCGSRPTRSSSSRDELWPDFTREAFERALDEYAGARAPLRGPLMPRSARLAAAAAPAARAPRARARRTSVAASLIGDPGARSSASCSSGRAGCVFALGVALLGARLPARAVRDVRRAPSRCGWPASSRCWACSLAAHYGDAFAHPAGVVGARCR